MIESRLKGKACVGGDITLGQCRRAVTLANEHLSELIGLPVRCEPEALYRRVRNMKLQFGEDLEVFQKLYLGKLDKIFVEFISSHFSEMEREDFWRREFKKQQDRNARFFI